MFYREAGQFKASYAADMAIFPIRQDRIGLGALLVFAFIGVPLLAAFNVGAFGHDYIFKAILIPFLILALAAIGLNILIGYCGQISLGSGAFMAIGAYSAYKFATGMPEIGLPPLPMVVSILLGGLMSAIVGILFGIPSLRIKGLYLAVATLAAQFFFDWVFLRVKWFTNYTPSGSVNAPELSFFGWLIDSPVEKYLLALAFVTLFALIAKNLVRSNIGRQWMAIRDMDIAAEIMGIRPLYAKLTAFAVSSFITGVAGALWAFIHLGSWEPLAFNIDRSFQLLFMVIIGGLGSILGSFLGAAFILILPIVLDQAPQLMGIVFALAGLGALIAIAMGKLAVDQVIAVRAAICVLLVAFLYWTWRTFFVGNISVETVSHLVFIIIGSLICYLLIVEPHGFARLWAITKERLRLWPFPY
jgi:branched-chain amino acid transport system permease protein